MKRCRYITFGCKINQYDTQGIRELVRDLGYDEVSAGETADLLVVNGCSVTDRAGEKGVAAVRRLVRENPAAQVIVTGCVTPGDRDQLLDIPGVDYVVGNEDKDQIPAIVQGQDYTPTKSRRSRNIFKLKTSEFRDRTRAFIKIHDGCDDFCTYCIIPYLRGKSMSREPVEVLEEAKRLAAAGYREVVLTGIHLRRYGADIDSEVGIVELMLELRQIPGIDRVRLSSIGMKVFTDEFLELFASDEGLCPFFHIPLQSGSNTVLERMRREYTREEYLETVSRIRAALPRAVVTTDWMVGFPGESEAEFAESLETCERAEFAFIHIFPFSRRRGTKADRFPDHVPGRVKLDRVKRARRLEAKLVGRERDRWRGETVKVLVERTRDSVATGMSREGHKVRFGVAGSVERNCEYRVQLSGGEGRQFEGVLLGEVGE